MNGPPKGWSQVKEAWRSGESPAEPPPPIQEPSLADLAGNFAVATARWAAAGFPVVGEPAYAARSATCAGCEFWDDSARLGLGKCHHTKCGCTRFKRWLTTERCPMGQW